MTWSWTALLVATLVVAGLTSSDGRTVTASFATNAVTSAGPYPGWTYGVPLLIGAALLLGATEVVLRLIGRRPAVVDADPTYDSASRELSAHRVLRGTHAVLGLTGSGVLFAMGVTLGNLQHDTLSVVSTAASGLALIIAVATVILTALPGRPATPAVQPAPRTVADSAAATSA